MDIQCRLYARILQDIISKDDYFKDFEILPYKDIVVCKSSLTPLVWDCPFTFEKGTLYFGKDNQIEMRDPENIAAELDYYLTSGVKVPKGIQLTQGNDLTEFLKKI